MHDDTNMKDDNGIVIKKSAFDVDETYARIRNVLQQNELIGIVAELDHQANAARVGLELRPTKIIMFGNPRLGTPLMLQSQTAGLDLPQKFLVYEDESGETFVAFNDPIFFANRHGISGVDEVLAKVSGALNKISDIATQA